MKGMCFLILGPSGAGKTTLINRITNNRAITTTSRNPRAGETDGNDYFFVSREKFEDMIQKGEFIEWAEYGVKDQTNYYGLTWNEFNRKIEQDDLFIVCDIQGVKHYKSVYPDAITIFVYTQFSNIKTQLIDRGGDKKEIEERISLYKEEMKGNEVADYVVKNHYGNIEVSVNNLKNIIVEAKQRGF